MKQADTVDSVTTAIGVGIVSGLIMIAAAATLIRIIQQVTAGQYARRSEAGALEGQPALEVVV